MTWIKLDNRAVDHPKVASLTDRAFRWWVKGLSYASAFLTDGLLPPVFWEQTPKQVRSELADGHLWDWVDPNFEIHDYLKHQSSRDAVDRKKAATAERVKRYRERVSNAVTPATSNAVSNALVTPLDTEIRLQRSDTENGEEQERPPRPLISGESNPRTWGKIHGEHVAGFCDWVCLPEFIFAEFARKSGCTDLVDGGAAYVRGWAATVRERWTGPVGDNLKFWRARWDESHPQAAAAKQKIRPIAEILADRERKSS